MTLGHITIYIRQSLFGISFIFACFRFIPLHSAPGPQFPSPSFVSVAFKGIFMFAGSGN